MLLISFAALVCSFCSLSSARNYRDYVRLADEFKSLDNDIASFIDNPTAAGWEDNLLDMSFYVRSLQSAARELDGGITWGTFREAEKVLQGGKPKFIEKVVDDEKFIMDLKIQDEQLQRLYYMQKFAKTEWEEFSHVVTHKKQMASLLL